jgi:hypothetical protein
MEMESKKTIFLREFNEALASGKTKYVVAVKLPTGATEIIINTEAIETKRDYCDIAYDDDLCLKSNPCIKLVNYMFC